MKVDGMLWPQMQEDAILEVHIEYLGNVRNERFKSKFSVLPTSLSLLVVVSRNCITQAKQSFKLKEINRV